MGSLCYFIFLSFYSLSFCLRLRYFPLSESQGLCALPCNIYFDTHFTIAHTFSSVSNWTMLRTHDRTLYQLSSLNIYPKESLKERGVMNVYVSP